MKQSIQEHNIWNLSPLAPAHRGFEDAWTQRWTLCEPKSMEQNVQVLDEHCQHGITIKQVWENFKTLSFRGHGNVKNELGWRTLCRGNNSKPELWTRPKWFMTCSLSQRNLQTKRRNGQHGEAPRSEKQLVVDMFAKSGFGTQQICSQVRKHEKHTFESEI